MIDLRRLRGLASGVGLVSALALSLALTALPPVLGAWMSRLGEANRTSPLASYQMVGGRIAAAIREGWGSSGRPGDRRLGITLGASQALCAIDTAKLSSESGACPTRWLPCAGLGVTPVDMELLTDLILKSSLRPDRALIGIDTGMLAKVKVENFWYNQHVPVKVTDFLEHMKHQPGQLATDLVKAVKYRRQQLLPYREAILRHFPVELFDLRVRLFSPMGSGPQVLFAPDSDPWEFHDPEGASRPDEVKNEQLINNQWTMGRFDPESYAPDGPNIKALIETVRKLRAIGAQVVIVALPEESRVRRRVPAEAMNVLRRSLERACGKDTPPILDLRELLRDDQFRDILHVNLEGRERVTTLLASLIPPPR